MGVFFAPCLGYVTSQSWKVPLCVYMRGKQCLADACEEKSGVCFVTHHISCILQVFLGPLYQQRACDRLCVASSACGPCIILWCVSCAKLCVVPAVLPVCTAVAHFDGLVKSVVDCAVEAGLLPEHSRWQSGDCCYFFTYYAAGVVCTDVGVAGQLCSVCCAAGFYGCCVCCL